MVRSPPPAKGKSPLPGELPGVVHIRADAASGASAVSKAWNHGDPSLALILARRRRALTGSSRGLSRAYNKGDLVRVRAGAYYNKPAWLALKPWERYSATVAAVAAIDPSVNFCYLTALRIWRLPSPRVPDHIHMLTSSPHKAGRLPSDHPGGKGSEDRLHRARSSKGVRNLPPSLASRRCGRPRVPCHFPGADRP